ncbi:hypothetical protein AHMF7605_21910 [Adhaeribacter arboris]|uniref:Uncharacterized protein n=1 Tax=Adhaeribacter arboris TaxID=2072846 RepID=A0A2T2YKC8_9BACT|nr:hypothetical protein [Adhaeribacter arboris]PSR55967.1 hypothetical protein AHMF7605_21910 [Adhaeribacter arboris]
MKLSHVAFVDPGYNLSDFIDIPHTGLPYKKHFAHLAETKELPMSVYNFYFPDNKPIFQYLWVKGILPHPIPVSRVAFTRLLQENNSDKFLYIPNYQQGFFQGFEASFIPFVDTTEHRKELILKEINRDISTFPSKLVLQHKDFASPKASYSPQGIYEYGLTVGKVYKAWSYLLENPLFYATTLLESGKNATDTSLKQVLRPSQKKNQAPQVNPFKKLGSNEDSIKLSNPADSSKTNPPIEVVASSPPEKNDTLLPAHLPETTSLNLFHVFEDISKYKLVMNLFVEQGYLQPATYIWKDENKGYKGLLAALLKYLHRQGYYKNNIELTPHQIACIAKNTFGRTIAIITIKKAKPEEHQLPFIPPASTLS